MRKLLCSLILGGLVAAAGNCAIAQTGDSTPPPPPLGHWGRGPMDPAAEAAHLARRLSLTAQQQTEVQTILTSQQSQMKALNENQSITHQQWLVQTRALHEQTRSQIEALLTETQKAAMAERMHPGGPRGDGQGPPPPPQ